MSSLKGGNVKLEAVPIINYSFEYGGNESENAVKMLSAMADKQNTLNNTLSGGRGSRMKRGGSNGYSRGGIIVPQFNLRGPQVSNITENSLSVRGNSTLITAMNNAMNDDKLIYRLKGGGKKSKRNKKSKKYKKTNKRICRRKYCKKSRKH